MKCLLTLIVVAAMAGEASACWLFGGWCKGGQSQNCQPCQPQGKAYYTPLGQYPNCPGGVCPAPAVPAKPAVPKELPPKLETKPAPKELKVENDRPVGDGSEARPFSRAEFLIRYGYDPFGKESTVATVAPAGSTQEVLLSLHNAERQKAGLPALVLDDSLNASAQAWSDEMARRRSMTHGGGGFDGQNIAWNQSSPEAVVSDWMNSSGHRRAILNSGYTRVGFGLTNGANGPYWTTNFGR